MSKKVSGWPLIAPKEIASELPSYTDADADKMLVVGADETDVVPQQTVTAELGGAELSGLVESLFVPGAAVKIIMDGVAYPIVTVTEETSGDDTYYEALFFESEGYSILYFPGDEGGSLIGPTGTHTIEAVVMDVTGPAWVDQPVEPKYTIPDITAGDEGKVLAVNSSEDGVEWVEISAGKDIVLLFEASASNAVVPATSDKTEVTIPKAALTNYVGWTILDGGRMFEDTSSNFFPMGRQYNTYGPYWPNTNKVLENTNITIPILKFNTSEVQVKWRWYVYLMSP